MPTKYTVRSGDCLSSIAAEHGFDDWRLIYDAPANEAFRKKRPNHVYGGGCHRAEFERHVAEVCVKAASQVQK